MMALILASCASEMRETARAVSPDGHSVAVIVWFYAGGAAGSATRAVYLAESKGQSFEHPVLTALHCESLAISWTDSHTLQVSYDSNCTIKAFENRWSSPSDIKAAKPASIEITLKRN